MSKVASARFTIIAEIESDSGVRRMVTHAFELSVPDAYSCTDTESAFIYKSNAFQGNLVRELSATIIHFDSGKMERHSGAEATGESAD